MPSTECQTCLCSYWWRWEEAFDKFGFGDGDGQVMTGAVAEVLEAAGFEVHHDYWGVHNDVIRSIKKDGVEQIPDSAEVGYDAPRDYLPQDIITLLDEKLPEDGEVQL